MPEKKKRKKDFKKIAGPFPERKLNFPYNKNKGTGCGAFSLELVRLRLNFKPDRQQCIAACLTDTGPGKGRVL
jgi:hypothetical protein